MRSTMRQEMLEGIIDILQTLQDAAKQLQAAYTSENLQMFEMLGGELLNGIESVGEIARQCKEDAACERLGKACICAADSLKDIMQLVRRNPGEVAWKLECELLMILENMALEFYYWELVNEHPERMEEFRRQMMKTGYFYRLEQPVEERVYACDLSIQVIGYNHLDVTKKCTQSLLANLPKDVSYELVLFNHGSDDGTREFFESIEGAHVINLTINRAFVTQTNRAMRGKYSLYISNDVFVGGNAIDNMYRAIAAHDDYGWIVPTTPNVSNCQTIPANYHDEEGFLAFVQRNNIYDERRHEVRTRLCNPVTMIRTDDYSQFQMDFYEQIYCVPNISSFPDDKMSLWMRRHGYKSILAKDAYCHHVGSVTLKNDFKTQKEQKEFYDAGRWKFWKDFGVDPWGTGAVYSPELFAAWHLSQTERVAVLGINCGLGSNSLKVKEILREHGSQDVILYNATQEDCYLQDLKGVSDEAFVFDELGDIGEKTGRNRFDYIVIDDQLRDCAFGEYLDKLDKAGIGYGEIAFRDEEGNWHIVRGN